MGTISKFAALAAACGAVVLSTRVSLAADVNAAASGDWSAPGTWTPNEPTATDNAFVGGGFAVGVTQAGETAQRLDLGLAAGSGGTVNVTGGDLTIAANGPIPSIRIGQIAGSTGLFTMSGGTVTVNGPGGSGSDGLAIGDVLVGDLGTGRLDVSGGTMTLRDEMAIGVGSGSQGTVNLTGGTITNGFLGNASIPAFGSGRSVIIGFGNGGTGTMNVNTAGTLTVRFDVLLGLIGNANGTLNIDAGGTVNTNFTFASGSATGVSTINQTGGSYNHIQGAVIGQRGTTTYNHSGGTYTAGGFLSIGDDGTGVYNLSGSAVTTVGNEFLMGVFAAGNGTVNQSGGTATAARMVAGRDGVGVYNQSGGSLNVASVFLGDYDTSSGTHRISGGTVAVSGNYSVGGALASNAPPDASRTGTQGQAVGAAGTLIVRGNGATINIGGQLLANPADNTRTDGPDNSATLRFEILSGAGTSLVNVTGAADLDGAIIDMALEGFTPSNGQIFNLISAGGGFGATGTGTTQNTGTGEGYALAAGDSANWILSVVSTGGSGEMLRATYVPEPASLAALGLSAVLLRRRKA